MSEQREGYATKSNELEKALREIESLKKELDAVKFAAHMPADYKFGLPSWINQKLYMAWIGADWSPEVMEQINTGKLTFADAPVWKERDDLRNENAKLKRLLDNALVGAKESDG